MSSLKWHIPRAMCAIFKEFSKVAYKLLFKLEHSSLRNDQSGRLVLTNGKHPYSNKADTNLGALNSNFIIMFSSLAKCPVETNLFSP